MGEIIEIYKDAVVSLFGLTAALIIVSMIIARYIDTIHLILDGIFM